MLELAQWYMQGEHRMNVIIWRYLELYPREKKFRMVMDKKPDGEYHPTAPVCGGNRTMMAVTCEGNAVPCIQISDIAAHLGHTFDNLHKRRLEEVLKDGEWLDAVCKNHYWLREQNKQCDECQWSGHCGGGCRAFAILCAGETTGKFNYSACDPLACLFYKGGWYERVKKCLNKYEIKDFNRGVY